MKFLMMALGALLSVNAFADFECTGTDTPGYRINAKSGIDSPSLIQVQFNGKTIYRKPVVELSINAGTEFRSLIFKNKNKAPAVLSMSVYQDTESGALVGRFSESSYLPVVPYLQLSCRQVDSMEQRN